MNQNDLITRTSDDSENSITRSELVELLSQQFPQLLPRDVEMAVKTLLDTMTKALVDGKRIELRGVGSFVLHHRPARVGRNPKSGDTVHIPEKKVPHFKPGKELRERVDYKASANSVKNGKVE
ncbi:MAG: integration host factor subunit beta [Betaproteobacteria bacterium]|jgi:integration host factor subunit beta